MGEDIDKNLLLLLYKIMHLSLNTSSIAGRIVATCVLHVFFMTTAMVSRFIFHVRSLITEI